VSSALPIQVRGQHQVGRARIRHVELRRRGGEIGDPIRTLAALGRSGESLASFRKRLPATLSTPDLRIACEHPRKAEVVEAIAERLRRGGSRIFGNRRRTRAGRPAAGGHVARRKILSICLKLWRRWSTFWPMKGRRCRVP